MGLTRGLGLTFDLGVNKRPTPTCGTQAVATPGPEAPQVRCFLEARDVFPGDERKEMKDSRATFQDIKEMKEP